MAYFCYIHFDLKSISDILIEDKPMCDNHIGDKPIVDKLKGDNRIKKNVTIVLENNEIFEYDLHDFAETQNEN